MSRRSRNPRENVRRAAAPAVAAAAASRAPVLRRALRLAVPVVVGIAALVGVGVAAARATEYLDSAPRFRVDAIDVVGAGKIDRAALLRRSGLRPGESIFDVDLEAARARLLADPRIESVGVEKRLPSTIRIRVVERVPVALLAGEGGLFMVGDDGTVFERVTAGAAPDLVVLTGFDLRRRTDDPVGLRDELVEAVSLLRLIDEIGLPGREAVDEVHRSVGGGFDLVTSSGVPIHLGPGPYRGKLGRLGLVAAALAGRSLAAAGIDISGRRRPERVTVRVKR